MLTGQPIGLPTNLPAVLTNPPAGDRVAVLEAQVQALVEHQYRMMEAMQQYADTLNRDGALDIVQARITASHGIIFPATQNASADPNTLDDYGLNDFTPALGGTATYNARYGRYVKVGSLVVAWGRIEVNLLGTGSATTVSGLPFTARDNAQAQSGSCGFFSGIASTVSVLVPVVLANTTTLQFTSTAGAGGASMSIPTTVFQNSAIVNFTAIYEATN